VLLPAPDQLLFDLAKQGNADAQNNLGAVYANNKGTLKDAKQAVYWYQKAADQGQAKAQYNLED
jgi:TPR repeat protein